MAALNRPMIVLKNKLSNEAIEFFKRTCRTQLNSKGIPCYGLIDHQENSHFLAIKKLVEAEVGCNVNYLNDFYMYTDVSAKAGWHMDTELYTFDVAINVWILLSPDHVQSPLSLMPDLNQAKNNYYHSLSIDNGMCEFVNMCNGQFTEMSLAALEEASVLAPDVNLGDMIMFDPKYFHKTNTNIGKHCLVIKFVVGDIQDCLSREQVPSCIWPEVDLFNRLIGSKSSWDEFLSGLRAELKSEKGLEQLSAGFYPGRFSFYKENAKFL